MPMLGEYRWLLDIVFFLYPSDEHARRGSDFGGTGFLVGTKTRRWPTLTHLRHVYAVSNWHVAVRAGCSVIRINTRAGGSAIVPLAPHDWHFVPRGHDVAIARTPLSGRIAKIAGLGEGWYLIDDDIRDLEIDAGEDAFMIGRFIDYEKKQTNHPFVRFGNLSAVGVNMSEPTGYFGPNCIVDMHSRTGFSGSPVFIYRTHGSIFMRENTHIEGEHMIKLLGVHWGQFPEKWEIKEETAARNAREDTEVTREGQFIHGVSGLSCVCPATAILDTLALPKVQMLEEQWEEQIARQYGDPPDFGRSPTSR